MTTITVPKDETKFYLDNIKVVKTWCDPCEIRVKKYFPPTKEKADIKHAFFYVPIATSDVCLIGTKQEILQSEKKLREFLQYRKDAPNGGRTLVCFLLPAVLKNDIRNIRDIVVKSSFGVTF